ncbi:MAG: hypothetical protein Q8T09_09065 [Candidatus Melainabacteria bacterium]|nr:hypothetical protein [Candidatus Melainabacteria bacterium]
MSDSPPKDQPKIADANQGAANSGENTGLKFDGYKVPLTSDQKLASASGASRELGLSSFSNMDDHLKNLKMAQTATSDRTAAGDKAIVGDRAGAKPILEVQNRGTSAAFAQEVASGVATLPEKVAQELKDKGVQVNVFKNIYEYDRAMGTNKAGMVVNGHHVALDAPSLFDGKGKPPNIAVFEQLGDGTPVKSLKNTNVAGLARHEAGHAYSAAHGFLSVQDKKFQAAMVNDVNNISPAQMQQLMKEVQPGGPMNYYLGSPAKEEFFAEAFATATGQGSDKYANRRMQELFPNVMKYMRDSTRSK